MPGVLIEYAVLVNFGRSLFTATNVPIEAADLLALSLGTSNLRGVDSHGFQLVPFYIAQIKRGDINIYSKGRVIHEAGTCMVYDGDNGIGQIVARECCDQAIRIAKESGTAVVVARESNHFGAAAFWAQRISASGLLGIVMCNASPLVAPWQGREPRLGTNPICVSIPGPNQWLLDMATTAVAMGKIIDAHISGKISIPLGWALDRNGVPTTSTLAGLAGLPMPLGGYKGYGLAMMIEILAGALSGGALSTEVGDLRTRGRPMRVSQFFMALDVSRFLPLEQFVERVGKLVKMVKSSAVAEGYTEVLVTGEPEWRTQAERRLSGIPLGEALWKALKQTADSLHVPVPSVRAAPNSTA
jgi:LDH2 family malate/lactate/ureidoglycolate dehydrogenase